MRSFESLRCGPCSFEAAPIGRTTTVSGVSTFSASTQVRSSRRTPRDDGEAHENAQQATRIAAAVRYLIYPFFFGATIATDARAFPRYAFASGSRSEAWIVST